MKETSSPRATRFVLLLAALVPCLTAAASARGPEATHRRVVAPGWNLLALPVGVSSGIRAELFPAAVSSAYTYRPSNGYGACDTLYHGMGFWLKFASADTVFLEGAPVLKDTVEVIAGWNLIGAPSAPLFAASVVTEPPGIVSSPFFRYEPGGGHQADTVLKPGIGYWVKISQDGAMVLTAPGGPPCPGTPTVEYAGRIYSTVLIGSQCWLKENLDVGSMIPNTFFQLDNDTIEKYCYDNDSLHCATYGGLYPWNEAVQYEYAQGVRGLCPPGWHVRRIAEFKTLRSLVGGHGHALKEIGDGAGTNASGFSALLAGFGSTTGFLGRGFEGTFWISTVHLQPADSSMYLVAPLDSIFTGADHQHDGMSVRCLRDEPEALPPAVGGQWAPGTSFALPHHEEADYAREGARPDSAEVDAAPRWRPGIGFPTPVHAVQPPGRVGAQSGRPGSFIL